MSLYQVPDEFFFRLHHVRPRFKEDVEDVLLFVANSIAEQKKSDPKEFNRSLNKVIRKFKRNQLVKEKTIDNWRTEISALFSFIEQKDEQYGPSHVALRLANNQYLDQFFNYFLYGFQYPGGHVKSHNVVKQLEAGIRFAPCRFILQVLIEGGKLLDKPFSINAEELTHCAYYDLRVTTGERTAKEVAKLIIKNREQKITYDHRYEQLKRDSGDYPSKGDVSRYAGDILDYMVLANLLTDKGTGFYYSLQEKNDVAIDYHLENPTWFDGYDHLSREEWTPSSIRALEPSWHEYVNQFVDIEAFEPQPDLSNLVDLSEQVKEYYQQIQRGAKVPTKIIGDYGETLVLVHEHLRTKGHSNRQHLIQFIPTHLGVGYDVQSIEIESQKRYIEVKTTRSKKVLTSTSFRMTPNEWDTAETLGDRYFVYRLVVNEQGKSVLIIQNPVKLQKEEKLTVYDNWNIDVKKGVGQWLPLLEN